MNKDIIGKIFPEKLKAIEEGRCPDCGVEIKNTTFIGTASMKEFQISGLCQKCQDKVFGSAGNELSACCGAPVTDTGRCSDCKEML